MEAGTGKSEIARFREQQALEEESARLALTGYAVTSRHDFINARMQRGGERILQLIDQGKHEEALALMNSDTWGAEEVTVRKGKGRKRSIMQNNNLNRIPTLRLNFNDLTAVRGIIRAYITYTRRASKPTRERDEQIQVLEHLYVRLANLPANVPDIAILLSTAEVVALDRAIAGFCAFVRSKVPPSQERDETLQDVERMREALAHML